MPRHVVSYRPLEGEERDQLVTPPIAKTDEWGCAAGVLAVAAVLGCALGAALQVVFQAAIRIRFLPLVTMGLLTFIAWRVAGAIRRTERERRQRLAEDVAEDAAEVVEVWDPVVVQQEGDDQLAFFLDIGGGKILVLAGDELRDVPEVRMGRPWLPPPQLNDHDWQPPFLNSHFVLHRGRRSGRIFRIDVLGVSLALSRIVPAATFPMAGAPSAIIEGSLEPLT